MYYSCIKELNVDKNIKEISNNDTIGILICKRGNKFVIEYCSDERIAVRVDELVWYSLSMNIVFYMKECYNLNGN